MDELAGILARWRAARGDLARATLATVVHVRGPAYRRPGARMLVLPDGGRIGTISGGCLEGEVVRRAWWWTEGGPTVRVFDNTVEDAARDLGLGCNGVVTVLLERAGTAAAGELLGFLDDRRGRRAPGLVATVVDAACDAPFAVGDRLLHDGSEVVEGNRGLAGPLAGEIDDALATRRSRLVHLAEAAVFVEPVLPPQRLFVFEAGHDAAPLSSVAALLGWEVVVADAHAGRLRQVALPGAARLVALPARGGIGDLGIGADDAVVLMTHSYPLDLALLPDLVAAGPRYLGLLGPRDRSERLFADAGTDPNASNVHAPIGLDIGGDQPEAIALSIVAEIQATLQGRSAASLRGRAGAIHEPALERGARRRGDDRLVARPACGLRGD